MTTLGPPTFDANLLNGSSARGRLGSSAWRASDWLFLLGVVLIPFDNFVFAPSRGWGAVAPLAFAAYAVFAWPELGSSLHRLRKILLSIGVLAGLSTLNYWAYPPDPAVLVDVGRALFLGVTFLVALDVFFRIRGHQPDVVIGLLAVAYGVSLMVGLVQWFAVSVGSYDIVSALTASMKRSALKADRIQFTFTEPTFIGMHVYGVLLPVWWLFRDRPIARSLLWVGGGIALLALVAAPSLRFFMDTVAILAIWAIFVVAPRGGKYLWGAVGLAGLALALALVTVTTNERIQRVLQEGVVVDGSLSARLFRVQATSIGLAEDPRALWTGHGFSNLWVPFHRGYPEAKAGYNGDVWEEVDGLRFLRPASLHSMMVRLVTELGLVSTLVVLVLLFDRRNLFLYAALLYVYLLFDSLAFYTLWIYLYFCRTSPIAVPPWPRSTLAAGIQSPGRATL